MSHVKQTQSVFEQERPICGAFCCRGHVVPASTYRKVEPDQEMEFERDGIAREPFSTSPDRPVLMRGARHRLIWKHSLSPGNSHWLGGGRHSPNGYCLEVFARWARRKRLTAFSWQAFERQTDPVLERLWQKYRTDHHFGGHVRRDFSVRRVTMPYGERYFTDGLAIWLSGVRQHVRITDLAMAGGTEQVVEQPLHERCTELLSSVNKLEEQQRFLKWDNIAAENRLRNNNLQLKATIAELRWLRRQVVEHSNRLVSPQERRLLRAIYELNIISKGDLHDLIVKQQRVDREKRDARKAARLANRVPA